MQLKYPLRTERIFLYLYKMCQLKKCVLFAKMQESEFVEGVL